VKTGQIHGPDEPARRRDEHDNIIEVRIVVDTGNPRRIRRTRIREPVSTARTPRVTTTKKAARKAS